MSAQSIHALLIDLQEPWAMSLGEALSAQGSAVCTIPYDSLTHCLRFIREGQPDIVFCSAVHCQSVLDHLRANGVKVPFVAVSRIPEEALWLDALESGAADYCAAPFEPRLVQWVLQTGLQSRKNLVC